MRDRMKRSIALLFLAGLALAIGLVLWRGIDDVVAVLARGGWQLCWLGPLYLLPLLCAAINWRHLFAPGDAPAFGRLLHASWIGLSVNWLLPVAQIGGEVVMARLLILGGVPGARAGASVVVDKTVQAFTQLLYALIGLVLLLALTGGDDLTPAVLGFSALFALGIYGFYRVQRAGLFAFLARFAHRLAGRLERAGSALDLVGGADALDAAVNETYQRWVRVLWSVVWRMAFRLANAAELWLILYFFGHPIGVVEAIVLQSLGQAVRAAAFAVPGGLGVQEGGYMLLGAILGIGPEIALAASLAKRFRELLVGLPGLIAWQVAEGRWVAAGRRQQS